MLGPTRPMSISGASAPTWPTSKHSCSGVMPSSRITSRNVWISLNGFGKTVSKTKALRRAEYFA